MSKKDVVTFYNHYLNSALLCQTITNPLYKLTGINISDSFLKALLDMYICTVAGLFQW